MWCLRSVQISTHHVSYEVVVSCRWEDSLSLLIYVYSYLMLTVLVTALVGADVDCTRYVVVAQCGAGG